MYNMCALCRSPGTYTIWIVVFVMNFLILALPSAYLDGLLTFESALKQKEEAYNTIFTCIICLLDNELSRFVMLLWCKGKWLACVRRFITWQRKFSFSCRRVFQGAPHLICCAKWRILRLSILDKLLSAVTILKPQ